MAVKNSLPKPQVFEERLRSNETSSKHSGLRISRLKDRADFLNARNGTRSHEQAFVLQLSKRASLSPKLQAPARSIEQSCDFRVGFTVTKKVGNAVVRNRIKRRLREAVKQAIIPSNLAGYDGVIIARLAALELPFDQLINNLSRAFAKHSDIRANNL